ncbi:MAG TPA: YggT family protein [Gammaproteobacteria bacterium]|nr:YggT family protein [Gammaproteobacteria bacterium]
MSPLMQAGLFLLDTVFSFFIVSLLLRILLQLVHADFYNPISQAVLKISNFFVLGIRRLIPGYFGVDWSSVLSLVILAFLKEGLLIAMQTGVWVNSLGLLLLALADILSLVFYIYLFATLIIVITSWLSPAPTNPLVQIAAQLISPLFRAVRSKIPPLAGFDLAPFVVVIGFILFNILVVQVIAQQGIMLIMAR